MTVSYFEWVQDEQHLFWEAQDVYNRLERVMKTAFRDVLQDPHRPQGADAHRRQHAGHRPRRRSHPAPGHLSVIDGLAHCGSWAAPLVPPFSLLILWDFRGWNRGGESRSGRELKTNEISG